ncbi:MAG: aldehyde-activating protein [Candidatus Cloacimonadota bacterium]|nr:MAG: aldehyde-activating protein [Candidatus Cloacimonadota bacterium]
MSNVVECLCKKIKMSFEEVDLKAGACHCSTCRTWGGGPLMATDCGTKVNIEGDVSVYDSSMWAERGFCNSCGTHLFYRLKEAQKYIVPVGLFNGLDFVFDHQVFIDEKPSFYCFANKTDDMTGPELFAQFS